MNVFMYDHDRTLSRSEALAPRASSLSTVLAIFFSVAMCNAVLPHALPLNPKPGPKTGCCKRKSHWTVITR